MALIWKGGVSLYDENLRRLLYVLKLEGMLMSF